MPKVIQVQKVPQEYKSLSPEDLLASFCYHFPQYTFNHARKLPYRRVIRMLKAARREKAKEMLLQLQIAVAPHTEKGKGVKDLQSQLDDIIKS